MDVDLVTPTNVLAWVVAFASPLAVVENSPNEASEAAPMMIRVAATTAASAKALPVRDRFVLNVEKS
jgi:hypothetical protein